MAAAAPSPHRSSPPSSDLSNAGASSSSPAPAVSSKKQQDVAAGRRRWEEFKKKKAQKSSTGPPPDESTSSEQQSGVGSTSGRPTTSAASNGHVSKDGRQDGNNTSSSNGPTTVEGAVVTDSNRQHLGNIPLSNAESAFSSGFSSSSDVDTIRGASVHATDQPNTSSSGPLFGRPEISIGFKASVPTTFANTDTFNKNGFGTTAAPVVADGPLVAPTAATATSPVPSYIGAPIAGHVGQEKGVRSSTFTPIFPASQPLPGNTSQRQGGGNLVHTNDRLFSPRGPREEAHPPSSMEPEQELVSSAVSVGFPPYVLPSELMRPDRHPDGTTSNAGTSAFLPSNKQSWRMSDGEMGKGSAPSAVNSVYSTVPSPSGTSESFAPVGSSPVYLPLPPPRSHHPWLSSFSPSSSSEASLAASMSNGSDFISSTVNISAQTSSFSASAAVSVPHRSAESSDSFLSGTKSSASTLYENGVVEPTTRLFSRASIPVLEPPTQQKNLTEPVDPPWQLPPTKSAKDDFAMLEQHIEDLTQEKFSLQRGLDAARALAETLAQENSALTEDYNKQGALVNELKEETQRLNGEIRAQAVVVKNMRSENDRALQESKAAIGRAQALAAEVIALEEKVLKSRSQELKLQRETESLAADNESQKRQIASIEKDRMNLRSLVEALQEEKTLLQTRLRKAVSVEDVRLAGDGAPSARNNNRNMEVSTSTEDLELEAFLTAGTAVLPSSSQLSLEQAQIVGFPSLDQQHGQPAIIPSLQTTPTLPPTHSSQSSESSSSLITRDSPLQPSAAPVGTRLGGRSLHLGPGSSIIPQDHVVIVENINTLIAELAEEKEALLKALRAESVGASELRALNAELSHKLEAQTQRLELAVAQSMAHGSTPTLENAFETSRLGPVYVDEGDEVVDRVLGWIMQLFPSGSSRRKRL